MPDGIPKTPIPGGENTTEKLAERFGNLEKAWKKFQEDQGARKAEAAKEPTFSLGGRIQFDSWNFLSDSPGIGYFEHPKTGVDPEDRVFFRRLRLEARGKIFETMLYQFQIDFANPNNPRYKNVFIGFTDLPGNYTVLVGNQKRPLGLANLTSSRFTLFMERALGGFRFQ